MELPPPAADGEIYLFTTEAAAAMGVAVCAISKWKKKGYLEPLPGSPPRKPLYSLSALRRAEEETRNRGVAIKQFADSVQRKRGVHGE